MDSSVEAVRFEQLGRQIVRVLPPDQKPSVLDEPMPLVGAKRVEIPRSAQRRSLPALRLHRNLQSRALTVSQTTTASVAEPPSRPAPNFA
jgi:hypothetical protein